MTNNRYTEAVLYLEAYVQTTSQDLCEGNQKLLDVPSKLDYCIDVLKAQSEYKGE